MTERAVTRYDRTNSRTPSLNEPSKRICSADREQQRTEDGLQQGLPEGKPCSQFLGPRRRGMTRRSIAMSATDNSMARNLIRLMRGSTGNYR